MKRIFTAITCASLCAALTVPCCLAYGDTSAEDNDAAAAKQTEEEAQPQPGLVDDYGAIGPVVIDDVYAAGIHYATLTIKGYDPMEVEIYGTSAPKTSSLFCNLLMRGYYDGKSLNGLMTDLYAQMGDRSGKTAGKFTVEGEFKEAGYSDNHMGLKRGVIAMSRSSESEGEGDDAGKIVSDASSLYVFLSDASYLDDKYAGFAKITKGISTFNDICTHVASTAKVKDDGSIAKEKDCPVIESFELDI